MKEENIVKAKVRKVKSETEKSDKVMDDPTLDGKDENKVGRVKPKPEHALKKQPPRPVPLA
jgi:hypothetical protein